MIFLTIWLLITVLESCSSVCYPLYGGVPCNVVPAPPGKTPPCARPGSTYCEHPDHYPADLITFLIRKWKFDHSTLLTDESRQEFTSYSYPPPSTVYGPPAVEGSGGSRNYSPNNVLHNDGNHNFYPEPIFIPKPQIPFAEPGHSYIPPKLTPPQNFSLGYGGYPNIPPIYQDAFNKGRQPTTYKYSSNIPAYTPQHFNSNLNPSIADTAQLNPQLSYYHNLNKIWKGNERLKRSLRLRRSHQTILRYLGTENYRNSTILDRTKRQSTLNGEPLCRTRAQYIMPRTAVNVKGNWMFVVNMPEAGSGATQMVKSETCASQTCNGICGLPQGYSSKCEQKYAQKRLVAVASDGQSLYNDVFWFPSCCVCTVSNV